MKYAFRIMLPIVVALAIAFSCAACSPSDPQAEASRAARDYVGAVIAGDSATVNRLARSDVSLDAERAALDTLAGSGPHKVGDVTVRELDGSSGFMSVGSGPDSPRGWEVKVAVTDGGSPKRVRVSVVTGFGDGVLVSPLSDQVQ